MANRRPKAATVVDIFKHLGKKKAVQFINENIHPIAPDVDGQRAQELLTGMHYSMHKDLPNLAAVAVQRFNGRNN